MLERDGSNGGLQTPQGRMTGRTWLALAALSLLGACMAPPPAPVIERDQPPGIRINYHLVSAGDTLHTIAWRYEIDHQQLATLNNLQPPYRLEPGQRLRLADVPAYVPPPEDSLASGARAVPVTTGEITAETLEVEPISVEPAPAPAAGAPAPSAPADAPPVAAATAPGAMATAPAPEAPAPMAATPGGWQWPVNGTVTREYDANKVFKGINIHSSPGTPVKAAGAGTVVYAGSGLRGYGQLIILKHDDTYLSAYAHNSKILVSENDSVSQGQTIAEVGGDPADPSRLYFEIREHGKSVDPEPLLPPVR